MRAHWSLCGTYNELFDCIITLVVVYSSTHTVCAYAQIDSWSVSTPSQVGSILNFIERFMCLNCEFDH